MDGQNMNKPVLKISNLTKRLGGRLILDNINLVVYPGEIFGFLGPNGSGKTTTIKLILGLLKIESGEIYIEDYNIVSDFENAVAQVGGIIENPEMYKYLSGRDNLRQYARMMNGGISEERINEVIELVGLKTRIDDKISKYSLGMRQRLGLAQALLHKPRLLILDEPTNGLDPAGIKELRDILKKVTHEEGAAVFVSSHLLSELELMCDRVGVIDRGRVIGIRSMAEMQDTVGDGREQIELTVGDTAAAKASADSMSLTYTESKSGITVTCAKDEVPGIIRKMSADGVDIFEAVRVKKSLESAFLEMTNGTPNGAPHEVGIGGYTPEDISATCTAENAGASDGVYVPPVNDEDVGGGESK